MPYRQTERGYQMDSLLTCLQLALGGALGTLARYGLSLWAMPISQRLPWWHVAGQYTGLLCSLDFLDAHVSRREVSGHGAATSFHHGRNLWRLYHLLGLQ